VDLIVRPSTSTSTSTSHIRVSRLVAGGTTYIAVLATAEVLVRTVGPLPGAACFAVMLIALVNLAVLARVREADSSGFAWRVFAVATIPPLERLLVLCMPPISWGRLQDLMVWTVPFFVGVIAILRSPTVTDLGGARPRLARTLRGGYGIAGLMGQVLVAIGGLGLGVWAGALAEGRLRPIADLSRLSAPEWCGIAVLVFAGCTQELAYRAIVQPVATSMGGWVGVVGTSLLMAYVWLAWIGVVVAMPVIVASLLFGWAVRRWQALVGVVVGHGLFNLALALLWLRVLR
jgi:hypothetical protein